MLQAQDQTSVSAFISPSSIGGVFSANVTTAWSVCNVWDDQTQRTCAKDLSQGTLNEALLRKPQGQALWFTSFTTVAFVHTSLILGTSDTLGIYGIFGTPSGLQRAFGPSIS